MSERDTTKRPLDVAVIGVPMGPGTDDMDAVDPRHAPGWSGSLTVREAHLIMELVADSGALAAGLIHSALGARIL